MPLYVYAHYPVIRPHQFAADRLSPDRCRYLAAIYAYAHPLPGAGPAKSGAGNQT